MPFGLCNTPYTFEWLMHTFLEGILREGCLVYLDDIVLHGQTWQECLDWLLQVLGRLQEAGLKVKPSNVSSSVSGWLSLVMWCQPRRN